jgi:tellurite resistance protein TerC
VDLGQHGAAVWLGFSGLVLGLLILDLGVLNRRSHVLSFKEALSWSAGLVSLALLFGGFIYLREGTHSALEYYAGYLIELSLSVDNLFVFILLFQYFGVPPDARPKVLKWGILGAIVMRAIMIAAGAVMLEQFEWIVYAFGGLLVITGLRMLRPGEATVAPERNPMVKVARRFLPCTDCYTGASFVVRTAAGARSFTPLFIVLLVVEWTDLVFAIDSIPAVFGVTRDPFLVYSSNIFAVLGLRALYFLLAGLMDRFVYLKVGVAAILVFVGAKMIAEAWVHVPILLSLGVIVGLLALSVVASALRVRRQGATPAVGG